LSVTVIGDFVIKSVDVREVGIKIMSKKSHFYYFFTRLRPFQYKNKR